MKIEIITETAEDIGPKYLAFQLGEAWRQSGHAVRIRSIAEPSDGPDVALLHVDRSVIPQDVIGQLPQDCLLLNGDALDITKRRVSRQLVASGDSYDGPVIVKTNDNYYGLPDKFREPEPGPLRGLARRLTRGLLGRDRRLSSDTDKTYAIHPAPEAVPKWVWRSPHYVVERFMPERDGDFYVLRNWLFLGSREVGVTCWSRQPIVKSTNIELFVFEDTVPAEIRARRRELGFDFGKFDWLFADGKPVLLDANKTPTVRMKTGSLSPNMLRLALGIEDFCPVAVAL